MRNSLKEYEVLFESIKVIAKDEDYNGEEDYQQMTWDLETEIQDDIEMLEHTAFGSPNNPNKSILKDIKSFKNLKQSIKNFMDEYDFYDAESELDNMFSNRNDEDFDEDSMF